MRVLMRCRHRHVWTAWSVPVVRWNRLYQERQCILPKCRLWEVRKVKGQY